MSSLHERILLMFQDISEAIATTSALAAINHGGCGYVAYYTMLFIIELRETSMAEPELVNINNGQHFCVEWGAYYIDAGGVSSSVKELFEFSCPLANYHNHELVSDTLDDWKKWDLDDSYHWNSQFDRRNVMVLSNIFRNRTKQLQHENKTEKLQEQQHV